LIFSSVCNAAISQKFATVPGLTYMVNFMARNNPFASETVTGFVAASGAEVALFSFDPAIQRPWMDVVYYFNATCKK
jgi:hypothetical protein